jgi:hypothetical protein
MITAPARRRMQEHATAPSFWDSGCAGHDDDEEDDEFPELPIRYRDD